MLCFGHAQPNKDKNKKSFVQNLRSAFQNSQPQSPVQSSNHQSFSKFEKNASIVIQENDPLDKEIQDFKKKSYDNLLAPLEQQPTIENILITAINDMRKQHHENNEDSGSDEEEKDSKN